MKTILRVILAIAPFLSSYQLAVSQCTTNNATTCVCSQNGVTNCDLLPDMTVAKPPLLVQGSSGVIEYSQSGNGVEDGRLRISVSTPNIGFGPLEIHTDTVYVCGTDTFYGTAPGTCPNSGLPPKQLINQRVYHKNGNIMTYYDRAAGSMTYHPSHGHMHVDDWGVFSLRTQTGDPNPLNWPIVGTGAKLAFCLMDYGSCSYYGGHCVDAVGDTLYNSDFPNFGLGGGSFSCSPIVQGISSGYTDIYYQGLDGMYIQIPPGVCNGQYWIVVQLDPYNYFLESNENNNVLAVPFTLTQQSGSNPVITASGPTSFCQGKNVTLTTASAGPYLWSNGATTQSINVTTSGNYTVATSVGSCPPVTSAPVTVSVSPFVATASATPNSICSSGYSQLNATVTTGTTTPSTTLFSNNSAYNIPDNNATGASSPITVSGINPASLANGSVVSVKINITHTYDADIAVSLVSPSGQSVLLSNHNGGSNNNFTNTIFTMSAAIAIANGTAPFTGNFIPDGNLNSFAGNANGIWYLKVVDNAALDTGKITSWTLGIVNNVPSTYSYSWISNPLGFTSAVQQPTFLVYGSTGFNVTVSDGNGCSTTASTNVTVHPAPVVSITGLKTSYTVVDPIATLTGTPSGGTFSGTGISTNKFNPAVAGVGGPYSILYAYTDAFGCYGYTINSVTVTPNTFNCGVPQNVTATMVKATQAKINWTSASAPQFKIKYQNITAGTAVQFKTFPGTPNVLNKLLTGLSPSTKYKVWVKSNCNGVTSAYSLPVIFTTPAALQNETSRSFDMSPVAFPNPATDEITLSYLSENEEATLIRIEDVSGKTVYEKSVTATEGNNSLAIDFSNMSGGVYVLSLLQQNNLSRIKVIKK